MKQHQHQKFLEIEIEDRLVYSGQVKDGVLTGIGKLAINKQQQYEGEFKKGLFHGFGRVKAIAGQLYVGYWKKGLKHGLGYQRNSNGDSYFGFWAHGKENGLGMFSDRVREFKGEFKDGMFNGIGIFRGNTSKKSRPVRFQNGKLLLNPPDESEITSLKKSFYNLNQKRSLNSHLKTMKEISYGYNSLKNSFNEIIAMDLKSMITTIHKSIKLANKKKQKLLQKMDILEEEIEATVEIIKRISKKHNFEIDDHLKYTKKNKILHSEETTSEYSPTFLLILKSIPKLQEYTPIDLDSNSIAFYFTEVEEEPFTRDIDLSTLLKKVPRMREVELDPGFFKDIFECRKPAQPIKHEELLESTFNTIHQVVGKNNNIDNISQKLTAIELLTRRVELSPSAHNLLSNLEDRHIDEGRRIEMINGFKMKNLLDNEEVFDKMRNKAFNSPQTSHISEESDLKERLDDIIEKDYKIKRDLIVDRPNLISKPYEDTQKNTSTPNNEHSIDTRVENKILEENLHKELSKSDNIIKEIDKISSAASRDDMLIKTKEEDLLKLIAENNRLKMNDEEIAYLNKKLNDLIIVQKASNRADKESEFLTHLLSNPPILAQLITPRLEVLALPHPTPLITSAPLRSATSPRSSIDDLKQESQSLDKKINTLEEDIIRLIDAENHQKVLSEAEALKLKTELIKEPVGIHNIEACSPQRKIEIDVILDDNIEANTQQPSECGPPEEYAEERHYSHNIQKLAEMEILTNEDNQKDCEKQQRAIPANERLVNNVKIEVVGEEKIIPTESEKVNSVKAKLDDQQLSKPNEIHRIEEEETIPKQHEEATVSAIIDLHNQHLAGPNKEQKSEIEQLISNRVEKENESTIIERDEHHVAEPIEESMIKARQLISKPIEEQKKISTSVTDETISIIIERDDQSLGDSNELPIIEEDQRENVSESGTFTHDNNYQESDEKESSTVILPGFPSKIKNANAVDLVNNNCLIQDDSDSQNIQDKQSLKRPSNTNLSLARSKVSESWRKARKSIRIDGHFSSQFFAKHKPSILKFKVGSPKKLTQDVEKKRIFITDKNGDISVFNIDRLIFEDLEGAERILQDSADLRCIQNGYIVRTLSDNTLNVLDFDYRLVSSFSCNSLTSDPMAERNQYTGDLLNFLWFSGGSELSIFNFAKHELNTIDKFWINKKKKRVASPLFVVANRMAEVIIGVGHEINGEQFIAYRISNKTKYYSPSEFIDYITDWKCGALTLSEGHALIAGSHNNTPIIISMELRSSLKFTSKYKVQEVKNSRTIESITRIEGTNILLLSCISSILVVMYNKDEFKLILKYNTDESFNQISSIIFSSKYIFFIGDCESLGAIEFESEINMEYYNAKGIYLIIIKIESHLVSTILKMKSENSTHDNGSSYDESRRNRRKSTLIQIENPKLYNPLKENGPTTSRHNSRSRSRRLSHSHS